MINIHHFLNILEGSKIETNPYFVFTESHECANDLVKILSKESVYSNWGSRKIKDENIHFCRIAHYQNLIRAARNIQSRRESKPARAVS